MECVGENEGFHSRIQVGTSRVVQNFIIIKKWCDNNKIIIQVKLVISFCNLNFTTKKVFSLNNK